MLLESLFNQLRALYSDRPFNHRKKANEVGGNILFKKSEWGGCQQIPHHLWSKKTQLKEKSLK